MKHTTYSIGLLLTTSLLMICKQAPFPVKAESPLGAYDEEWNDPKYLSCNTASTATYMSEEERKTIYVLNLIRMNPPLFVNSVLKKYPAQSGKNINSQSAYYKSLMETLLKMKPATLLFPDSLCFNSAACHAKVTGNAGTVTHDRATAECRRKQHFSGECCHYGEKTALDILVSLLVDEGVPSLGHRNICLGSYAKLGVSIQPHLVYRSTAVLDFD